MIQFGCVVDQDLTALLRKAAAHVMTAEEIFEQRVSFVWGMLRFDDPRSRDDIRRAILAMEASA